MAYLNSTKGARAIHLTNGTYVLVEPGATADIDPARVRRVAPGIVRAKSTVPPVPADVAKKAKAKVGKAAAKPAKSELAAARADYKAKFGKQPGPRMTADAIREKIASA